MEEKKTYPIAEVTITTEEYRDLITEATENRKEADFEKQNRWKMEAEIKELKQKLKEAESALSILNNEIPKLTNEVARLEVELAYYKKGDTENERS